MSFKNETLNLQKIEQKNSPVNSIGANMEGQSTFSEIPIAQKVPSIGTPSANLAKPTVDDLVKLPCTLRHHHGYPFVPSAHFRDEKTNRVWTVGCVTEKKPYEKWTNPNWNLAENHNIRTEIEGPFHLTPEEFENYKSEAISTEFIFCNAIDEDPKSPFYGTPCRGHQDKNILTPNHVFNIHKGMHYCSHHIGQFIDERPTFEIKNIGKIYTCDAWISYQIEDEWERWYFQSEKSMTLFGFETGPGCLFQISWKTVQRYNGTIHSLPTGSYEKLVEGFSHMSNPIFWFEFYGIFHARIKKDLRGLVWRQTTRDVMNHYWHQLGTISLARGHRLMQVVHRFVRDAEDACPQLLDIASGSSYLCDEPNKVWKFPEHFVKPLEKIFSGYMEPNDYEHVTLAKFMKLFYGKNGVEVWMYNRIHRPSSPHSASTPFGRAYHMAGVDKLQVTLLRWLEHLSVNRNSR